jgi:hypothetical protein
VNASGESLKGLHQGYVESVAVLKAHLSVGFNNVDSSMCKALLCNNSTPFGSSPQHLFRYAGLSLSHISQ